jgi:hypothetical protein
MEYSYIGLLWRCIDTPQNRSLHYQNSILQLSALPFGPSTFYRDYESSTSGKGYYQTKCDAIENILGNMLGTHYKHDRNMMWKRWELDRNTVGTSRSKKFKPVVEPRGTYFRNSRLRICMWANILIVSLGMYKCVDNLIPNPIWSPRFENALQQPVANFFPFYKSTKPPTNIPEKILSCGHARCCTPCNSPMC